MIRRKNHPPLQGAIIALEPSTGAIVALVGGRDYTREPIQPRHHRQAPARQHVQALRVPGRLRGHLRRPRPAPHHAGHRRGGRADGVPVRPAGVRAAELRERLQGLRDAADRPRPQPQQRDGQGRGDGRVRSHRRPVEPPLRHGQQGAALPRGGPRLVRGHAAGDGVRVQHPRQHGPQGAARHRPQGHGREGQHDRAALPEPAPRRAARSRRSSSST